MAVRISYMGTKTKLSDTVRDIVSQLPSGPLLDAFSGMCAVGTAIAPSRQVWTNDIQPFAALVGRALFCASKPHPGYVLERILEPHYKKNLQVLEKRFKCDHAKEERYLRTACLVDAINGNTNLSYVGNDPALEKERKRLEKKPSTYPYRQATITWVGSFLGVRQCLDVDSIRYAIDAALDENSISEADEAWLLITLGQVVSRVNNSTGQFAHYLKPTEQNLRRILGQRRRSVWGEFVATLGTLGPVGTASWRARNRAYQCDALTLLDKLKNRKGKPSVVYADPPYSAAQYSRYYHVLDQLVEYRYAPVTGVGRYPNGRFQTPYALLSKVEDTLERFTEAVSSIGAHLVLSYPSNGLYCQRGRNVLSLLQRSFRHARLAHKETQKHSTFGGATAAPSVNVVENIYLAYN